MFPAASALFALFRLGPPLPDQLQQALAGQLVGIAAQGQGQGQIRQVLLPVAGVQAARRHVQGPVQLLQELGVQGPGLLPLRRRVSSRAASFTDSTCLSAHRAVR